MADSQENVEKLREAYHAWNDTRGGSVDTWVALMADDVVFHSPGSVVAGIHADDSGHGRNRAEIFFAGLAYIWEMIHFTPIEFVADGDRVVVLSHVAFRNRRTGKLVESPKCDVFQFRDGKVIEAREYFDTASALAATRPG